LNKRKRRERRGLHPFGCTHIERRPRGRTSGPAEIDAYLEEVVVEAIPRLSIFEKYRLNPLPSELEHVRGVHPRLYLKATRGTALWNPTP
jgi:hypothetical protein